MLHKPSYLPDYSRDNIGGTRSDKLIFLSGNNSALVLKDNQNSLSSLTNLTSFRNYFCRRVLVRMEPSKNHIACNEKSRVYAGFALSLTCPPSWPSHQPFPDHPDSFYGAAIFYFITLPARNTQQFLVFLLRHDQH